MTEIEVRNSSGEDNGDTVDENFEEDESSEDLPLDTDLIKSKFNNLASALQETNQNLVTFEYLLDHYKNVAKDSSKVSSDDPIDDSKKILADHTNPDIMNILKNICGSVNDLRSEMGSSTQVASLPSHEDHSLKLFDLTERCSKLEVENGFYKTKCLSGEDRNIEVMRKNEVLEAVLREKDEKIMKLNSYLKQSEDFSNEAQSELHYIKRELVETQRKLEDQEELNLKLNKELELYISKIKDLEEVKVSEHLETETQKEHFDKITNEDLELDLDILGQSARSTLSSKSGPSEEISEQKFKELKESRNRLKQKTKLLLRQYRNKRSLLEKKDRQLTSQRAGLLRLQALHQSVESNHYIVIHHLGQQILQTARLVGTLWPDTRSEMIMTEPVREEVRDRLSEWIIDIDNMSTWTISKLVKVSMGKKESSKRKKDCDKLRGTHHPLPEEEETEVKSKILTAAAKECQTGLEEELDTVNRLMEGLEEDNTRM